MKCHRCGDTMILKRFCDYGGYDWRWKCPRCGESEGSDGNRQSAHRKGGTMEKESKEGNLYYPGMTNEIKMYRSRKTGRRYAVSQVLDRGLLILKSEDGLGTAMTHENDRMLLCGGEYALGEGTAKPDDFNDSMKKHEEQGGITNDE